VIAGTWLKAQAVPLAVPLAGRQWGHLGRLQAPWQRRSLRDILDGVNKDHSALTGSEGDRRLLAQWASDCAERVLPLFEACHSGDDRPRKAVEAARAWVRGEIRVGQARKVAVAAHAAARDATDPAARAAARSTGQATGTAHMGLFVIEGVVGI